MVKLKQIEPSPSCRCTLVGGQSIVSNTPTAITFNSERWDTDSIHVTSGNNTRLTCKTAGTYLIGGNIRFAIQSGGFRDIRLQLNGSTVIAFQRVPTIGIAADTLSVVTVYQLALNDYVELIANQNSGVNLTVESVGNYSPEFWMHMLA